MGGDCLNTGCVPSKALLAAAQARRAARSAHAFGVARRASRSISPRCTTHVQSVIAAIAPNDSAERFTGLGVRVIKGDAHFKDRRTVAVGEQYEIRARRFVIATGSAPALPPIPGLDGGPYLTNETIFELTELPRHLIVIGAGPIGLELAQALPAARQRRDGAGGGDAARQGRSGMRGHRARPARTRRRRHPQRRERDARRLRQRCRA